MVTSEAKVLSSVSQDANTVAVTPIPYTLSFGQQKFGVWGGPYSRFPGDSSSPHKGIMP